MPNQEVSNALIEQHLKEQDLKIDKLVLAIEGNGKPGLKDRVRDLEACILPLKRFGWMVVGAIVTSAVCGFGVLLIQILILLNGKK